MENKVEEKESDSTAFRNKEKVLVTCSRRINYRYRHLMMNVVLLLPHCKKDNKVESKESKGATLNELVELKGSSSCLFFECRKQKDLYLWMAKCPNGPSVKFLVNAVHTMEELKLTGNHLKGSRPLLTFSTNFDKDPHWKLLKEMIEQIFGTPKDQRKCKPYHDHVFVFSIVDDHIWFRNYQISVPHNEADKVDRGGLDKMNLVEVGPRFCLNPIKIFGGSFGGPTLYENPFYVSPNQVKDFFHLLKLFLEASD
ncbi:Ribosome biogenesis protein [Actinidia chinensis var. chinensis]|uniref:Ribosome biogenesis protein n=1 Tax=Actinidia chinensis var. chinensis TaxID=1590841 RepID=A0A2R6QWR1_ACTCC|nr:Ribosome biogenesis protein [Actinidia chinensis var. chinensis]